MVIERFKNNDPGPCGERFATKGRMLPEGVAYVSSWLDPVAHRCYQVMEAENSELLQVWIDNWKDLVDFEVIPMVTSQEY